jgi:hypothetical protein
VRSLKPLLYSFDLGLCLEIEPDVHRPIETKLSEPHIVKVNIM